jgi:hypothetical protein
LQQLFIWQSTRTEYDKLRKVEQANDKDKKENEILCWIPTTGSTKEEPTQGKSA